MTRKEIELEIFKESGNLIVSDSSDVCDNGMVGALIVEVACGFNRIFDHTPTPIEISNSDIIDFFTILKEKGLLKTQPYFPKKILPVNNPDVWSLMLVRENGGPKEGRVISSCEYQEMLLKKKYLTSFEYQWISLRGIWIEFSLFQFLSSHLKNGRLEEVGRKERRDFMCLVDKNIINGSLPGPSTKLVISSWKKVAKVIHPLDYPEYREACKYIMGIVGKESKKKPTKPKLKNIMWKGWKTGNDYDSFEKYLDQPGLTVGEILSDIRDYEVSPRITKYKRTDLGATELGNREVGQEEKEIVDLIKLQLKEKLLKMLPSKKEKTFMRNQYYSRISVTKLLTKFSESSHNLYTKKLYIGCYKIGDNINNIEIIPEDKTVFINFYMVKTGKRYDANNIFKGEGGFPENFFITASFYNPKKGRLHRLDISTTGDDIRVEFEEIASSMILFHFDASEQVLRWVGESSKPFYSGQLSGIDNWEEVERILIKTPPTITISEICEKMYTMEEGSVPVLREDILKEDLEI